MTEIYELKTDPEILQQKAMDLRILERKFRPEHNMTLTGFTPRFYEAMMKWNKITDKRKDLSWYEMAKIVADYWIGISGSYGMERLADMAKVETEEFRDMCRFLVNIITRLPNQSKK